MAKRRSLDTWHEATGNRHAPSFVPLDSNTLILKFEKSLGSPKSFPFGELALQRHVTEDLAAAFYSIAGKYEGVTRGPYWGNLRRFATFLKKQQWNHRIERAPTDLLQRYVSSIESKGLHPSTSATYCSAVHQLLSWLVRNRPNSLWQRFDLNITKFTRIGVPPPRRKSILSEQEIKQILRASYKEIDEVWQKFQRGKQLQQESDDHEDLRSVAGALKELLRIGDGRFPSQRRVLKYTGGRILRWHKLSELKTYVEPSIEALLPFYLAICLQTAGNTMAILHLQRTCCRAHEIDPHVERIIWKKPRARRDQHRDFDIRRRRAAPHLVRMVLELTDSLARNASARNRNFLFLHACGESKPSTIGIASLHNQLEKFIKKHNLPNFAPADLRATVAAIEQRKFKDIFRTQRILNHSSVRTTLRYIEHDAQSGEHAAVAVRKFQGEFAKWCTTSFKRNKNGPAEVGQVGKGRGNSVPTVFGFDCRDPFSGVAPGSRRGKLCAEFIKCAGCTQAVVVVDDPRVAAKILQARSHLISVRDQMSVFIDGPHRFRAIYQPILEIIEREILPKFRRKILTQAARIVPLLPPLFGME